TTPHVGGLHSRHRSLVGSLRRLLFRRGLSMTSAGRRPAQCPPAVVPWHAIKGTVKGALWWLDRLACWLVGGLGRNRTADTRIFRPPRAMGPTVTNGTQPILGSDLATRISRSSAGPMRSSRGSGRCACRGCLIHFDVDDLAAKAVVSHV